jgi:hypothetical protein
MFENLENNIYDDLQIYENKFVPNKKELEKLEERKKIEESEDKLIEELFNRNDNDNNDNNDNPTNNKIYDLVSKENKNKQVVQRRKTIIENTNYNIKRINRENEKDK